MAALVRCARPRDLHDWRRSLHEGDVVLHRHTPSRRGRLFGRNQIRGSGSSGDDDDVPPRPAYALRARSSTRSTTRFNTRSTIRSTTAALRLEPCGDGTVDHLPADAKVPPSLARTGIRLPDRPGATLVVGRERPESDAVLPLGTVSGRHALFQMDGDGRLFVTDLGSSNGTDVDGRTLEPDVPFALDAGDVVTLGDRHLAQFRVAESRDALGDALSTIREGAAEAEKAARAVGDAYNAGASAAKKVGGRLRWIRRQRRRRRERGREREREKGQSEL